MTTIAIVSTIKSYKIASINPLTGLYDLNVLYLDTKIYKAFFCYFKYCKIHKLKKKLADKTILQFESNHMLVLMDNL